MRATCVAHIILLDLIIVIMFGEDDYGAFELDCTGSESGFCVCGVEHSGSAALSTGVPPSEGENVATAARMLAPACVAASEITFI
jgi:hypothetical protein